MKLVDQWRRIESGLPEDFADARLELAITDDGQADRAAALLAPLVPGRHGLRLRFFAARRGAGPGLEAISRAISRLDEEGIEGRLELLGVGEPAAVVAVPARAKLLSQWEERIAKLPPDWTDIYAEVEFRSSDHFDRAALLMAPLNPARHPGLAGFRFRVARRFGYGAAPDMARRCLERLDEDRIPGTLELLHVISDSRPVDTQGPVWHVGGKTV